ncbi:ATP-dependent DNA helicase RecQ [Pseudanabaena sp. FACHB-2040]|nr:ATP-dependent DNA helicase RecQ [Pseudanabaena sp. FACHB-2040]
MAWEQVLSEFQRIWGYSGFRSPQDDIVKALLEQRDTLVIMPTGGGKSICFQLPALLQSGLTLVVSPLVALMENQVEELRQHDLPAATLHSQMLPHLRRNVLKRIEHQTLRLLYLSPETLLSPPVWDRISQPQIRINGLILDEAHCLVQWGETFRPAYRRLGAVRPALLANRPVGTSLPIAAFTATADPVAQKILRDVLQLQAPTVVRLNPHRANLHLSVRVALTVRDRKLTLKRYLQTHPNQPGLVYVRTRKDSEELADWLRQVGFRVAPYHAGLGPTERRQIEADWTADRLQFVVCTSAFGVGINKPNTRWVIHYQAPCLITEYVQEVGRAGRDGKPAEALTLVSEPTGWLDGSDRQRAQFFETQTQTLQQKAQQLIGKIPKEGDVREVSQQFKEGAIALSWLHSSGQLQWQDPFHYRLNPTGSAKSLPQQAAAQQMHQFLHSRSCRWKSLLDQFGFRTEAQKMGKCGHCDNCRRS